MAGEIALHLCNSPSKELLFCQNDALALVRSILNILIGRILLRHTRYFVIRYRSLGNLYTTFLRFRHATDSVSRTPIALYCSLGLNLA